MPKPRHQRSAISNTRGLSRDALAPFKIAAGRIQVHLAEKNFAAARAVIDEVQAKSTRDEKAEIRASVKAGDLTVSLAELDLDVRTTNALMERGYYTVDALVAAEPTELMNIPNFGEKSLAAVYAALEKIGLRKIPEASM